MEMKEVPIEVALFEEDIKKIVESVIKYPLGSYQIGEIARISAHLYEKGINVVDVLNNIKNKYE